MRCKWCSSSHDHECEEAFKNGVDAAVEQLRELATHHQSSLLVAVAAQIATKHGLPTIKAALTDAERSVRSYTLLERMTAMVSSAVTYTEPSEASRVYGAALSVLMDEMDWAQDLAIREIPIEGDFGATRYVVECSVRRYLAGAHDSLPVLLEHGVRKWTPKPVQVLVHYIGKDGTGVEEAANNVLRLVKP